MKIKFVFFVMISIVFTANIKATNSLIAEKEIPVIAKTSCYNNEDININFNVSYNSQFENTLYPSFIYSFGGVKNSNGDFSKYNYFDYNISSNKKIDVKIRMTNNKFIEETIQYVSVKGQDSRQYGNLNPLWKYDELKYIKLPGQTFFHFEVIDAKSEKVLLRKDIQLSYRSINECIYAIEKKDGTFLYTDYLYASYVNEDSQLIDGFLSSALRAFENSSGEKLPYGWAGYQKGNFYVFLQVGVVVEYLHKLGMQYSSITDTSNVSKKVFSQYVRLIDESLYLQNANCVDGSVLLASIFEKIGLRCFLVLEPGHMYLIVGLTENIEEFKEENFLFVESTLISSGVSWHNSAENGTEGILASKKFTPETKFINIREARAKGIKPIQ